MLSLHRNSLRDAAAQGRYHFGSGSCSNPARSFFHGPNSIGLENDPPRQRKFPETVLPDGTNKSPARTLTRSPFLQAPACRSARAPKSCVRYRREKVSHGKKCKARRSARRGCQTVHRSPPLRSARSSARRLFAAKAKRSARLTRSIRMEEFLTS